MLSLGCYIGMVWGTDPLSPYICQAKHRCLQEVVTFPGALSQVPNWLPNMAPAEQEV